jgi:tRNA nucleotidyltransferase (CCA-adding enzyme)
MTVDEHTFEVVQAAADAGAPLRVRLAALFHDVGKPHVAWRGTDGRLHYYAKHGYSTKSHEQVSAELAGAALDRLRYPSELRRRVVRIVRGHMLDPGKADPVRARKLLARFGDGLAIDLLDHKQADLRGKGASPPLADLERLAAFRKVVEREKRSPHRLRDLVVDGDDLIALGYAPGPAIGRALQALLAAVVVDPTLNTRAELLVRAKELLG